MLDVSTFKHPGPQKLITNNIGKDVTELFDDIGHSASALGMIKDLTIGYTGGEGKQKEGALMSNAYASYTKKEKEMHERLDAKIDIKKPLLPQVETLTNEEFMAFVRRPRFINNEDGIQLFEDKDHDESEKRPFERNVIGIWIFVILCLVMSRLRKR